MPVKNAKPKVAAIADVRREPIRLMRKGINVRPLLDQIEAQPELWNQNDVSHLGQHQ